MSLFETFILAFGLSMDAFSVAICKGLSISELTFKKAALAGLYFGGFQAVMPVLGYFFGIQFSRSIQLYDHWAVFLLLTIIGMNMIREAYDPDQKPVSSSLTWKEMLLPAIATSIDALAVGVSLALLKENIWKTSVLTGLSAFTLTGIGMKIGSMAGTKWKFFSEITGGILLILIGAKILLSHLGFLPQPSFS